MNQYSFKTYKLSKSKYGSIASIVEEIKYGEKILDVGCSDGYLAKYLPHNEVYGIDYNPVAIQKAKETCKVAKVVDLNKITDGMPALFDEKFDVFVFADILEHLLFPEKVLRYFKKMMKPNGRLIISFPNVALWRVRLRLLFGQFNYTDYGVLDNTHLHLYTFKSAIKMVTSASFKIIKIKGAANFLGPVVRFLPIFKRLFSTNIIIISEKTEE